jgi:sterol desaturase/sphingolipid hydroxylase (fatty acid hydroxylase superfamily)
MPRCGTKHHQNHKGAITRSSHLVPTVRGMNRFLRLVVSAVLVVGAVLIRPSALVGLLVLAILLVPLELAFALHRRSPLRRGWRTDVAHFLVNSLLTNGGVIVVAVLVGLPLRALTPELVRSTVLELPAAVQFAVALGVVEMAAYWAHRAAHHVPALWRFHKVHHSPTELDWLAAAHLHPVDQIFVRGCAVIPLLVLGFSRATFGGYLVFAAFQAIFVHANVRFRFGPLRWLVVTPEYHHWHHAGEREHLNRNFSGLPIIDAMFGTLHLPKRWPESYGIDEAQPESYLDQLRWSFRAPAATPF